MVVQQVSAVVDVKWGSEQLACRALDMKRINCDGHILQEALSWSLAPHRTGHRVLLVATSLVLVAAVLPEVVVFWRVLGDCSLWHVHLQIIYLWTRLSTVCGLAFPCPLGLTRYRMKKRLS